METVLRKQLLLDAFGISPTSNANPDVGWMVAPHGNEAHQRVRLPGSVDLRGSLR